MDTRSIVITSALVAALATGVHAQRSDAQRSTTQQQTNDLRLATPGRLVVPVTGTVTTAQQTSATSTTATSTTSTSTTSIASSTSQVFGSFSIRRFAQTTTGDVAAVGMLTLNLTDPTSGLPRTIVTESAIRLAQAGDASNSVATNSTRQTLGTTSLMLSTDSRATQTTAVQGCETLSLGLRPVQVDLGGMTIRLDQANVDFVSRSTGQLRSLLCGTTNVTGAGTAAERMNRLNALLDVVG